MRSVISRHAKRFTQPTLHGKISGETLDEWLNNSSATTWSNDRVTIERNNLTTRIGALSNDLDDIV